MFPVNRVAAVWKEQLEKGGWPAAGGGTQHSAGQGCKPHAREPFSFASPETRGCSRLPSTYSHSLSPQRPLLILHANFHLEWKPSPASLTQGPSPTATMLVKWKWLLGENGLGRERGKPQEGHCPNPGKALRLLVPFLTHLQG